MDLTHVRLTGYNKSYIEESHLSITRMSYLHDELLSLKRLLIVTLTPQNTYSQIVLK